MNAADKHREKKKGEIRCNENRATPASSIKERIESKDPKQFDKKWFQYLPHEGETARLFFSLLSYKILI